MPAALFDIEALLTPLPAPDTSGPDLVYDPQFLALEHAGAGKPERQYGDRIYPAEPPDWALLHTQVLPLAERSRDLRLAVWLLRCATRTHGLGGAALGLGLMVGLLERLWDSVHPQLDASDDNDPTMRLNALAPLVAGDAVLADLRMAAITAEPNSLTLRQLELALSRAEPAPGEAVPTEAGVLLGPRGMEGLLQRDPGLADRLRQTHQAALDIAAQLERQVGADRAPDFKPLTDLLGLPVKALGKLQGGDAAVPLAVVAAVQAGAAVPAAAPAGINPAAEAGAAPYAIQNREDAVRELERVCSWIELHEPSNPAPLLIRRAQRLMNKNFLDIIRDLAPDGLNQIALLAGPEAQS